MTREGVKIVRDLFAQDAFKPYLGKPISPDEGVTSDADIEDWIAEQCRDGVPSDLELQDGHRPDGGGRPATKGARH